MTTRLCLAFCCAVVIAAAAGCTVETVGPDARFNIDTGPCMGAETYCSSTASCSRLMQDSRNCGACGNVCNPGTGCVGGTCSCHSPMLACGGVCSDPQSDHDNCGACGHACSGGEMCTGGTCIAACTAANHGVCTATDATGARTQVCVDLFNDSTNCGTCNTQCSGSSTCVSGLCTCPGGGIACGGACVNGQTDPMHCGDCLSSCGTGGTCAGGHCATCGTGLGLCTATGASPRCVDEQTSTLHCGACNHACGARQTCEAGVCTCPADLTNCGTSCADLQTDEAHCGVCATACATGATCETGACECPGTQTACSGTCVDQQTSMNHCGMCGHVCVTPQVCTLGACACPGTQTSCGAGCYDTTNTVDHCGDCATDCGNYHACVGSTCVCSPGYSVCGSSCVDMMTNSQFCGNCTTQCGSGLECHAGSCRMLPTFRVLTLSAAGCVAVDTGSANDDRGGVALSATEFFVQADTSALRLNAADLTGIAPIGTLHDTIVSDIESERVYVLLTATNTESTSSATFTQLGVIDSATGLLTPTRIPLSQPVTIAYGFGIMSGYAEALIGVPITTPAPRMQWTRISLPSGEVTTLGTTLQPAHVSCEGSGAFWGIAERSATGHSAVYVERTTQLSRTVIPDSATSTAAATMVATFTSLSDMCSITFSPSRNRWYFHHEYNSQFTPTTFNETAGYCSGTWDQP